MLCDRGVAASKLRNKPAFSNIILFLNSKESVLIARFRRLPRSLKTNQYPTSAALESCSITHPQFFLSHLSMFDSNQTTLVLENNSDFIMKAHPLYQSGPISKIFRGFATLPMLILLPHLTKAPAPPQCFKARVLRIYLY